MVESTKIIAERQYYKAVVTCKKYCLTCIFLFGSAIAYNYVKYVFERVIFQLLCNLRFFKSYTCVQSYSNCVHRFIDIVLNICVFYDFGQINFR
jgi:hypothetical protein